jgi:pimeloyl-ACP methyl ester carboxylesterase
MIHGAFCGAWSFDHFRMPFEAAGHAVTALDLPGHARGDGRSLAGLSVAHYADHVVAAARGAASPPVLIGHSMGGLVAQLAAARTAVAALVLLAPSPPWGVAATTPEEWACAFGSLAVALAGPVVEPRRGPISDWMLAGLDAGERRAVEGRLQSESGRALAETLAWALDPMAASLVPAAAVKAPVLGFAGERDAVHPPATVRATVDRLAGETRIVPGAGHWLVGQKGWERIAAESLDWISEAIEPVAA